MDKHLQDLMTLLSTRGVDIGLKILGALAFWLIGRWLIRMTVGLLVRTFDKRQIDPTIGRYLSSALSVLLTVGLVVSIFGYLGVQTTTFAALLAGVGLAIGTAWGGLLTNFAAGIFMVVLRPFKAGDFVTVGGITGTVVELGLFATTLNTPDNVRTTIGNNKIFSDTISNFTANPYRRVDLKAQLDHTGDPRKAVELLKARMAKIPNVKQEPAPEVSLLEFTLAGPVMAVRPYTHNNDYWQVYFDTNQAICESLGEAGFAIPQHRITVNSAAK
jgi:small conductance mechanosensitive channel